MRASLSHELDLGGQELVEHHARRFLALVDLESFPPLANRRADHLDVLAHISQEAQALTAVMWETPESTLKLKFHLTDRAQLSNEMARTHRLVFDGCVRTTSGRLCLTDDSLLLAAARRGARDLLHGRATSDPHCPHLIQVAPGVINVGVFCERWTGLRIPELQHTRPDYTILMRHYPFPPPRVAPVRLSGGLIPWAGADASDQDWGGRFAT